MKNKLLLVISVIFFGLHEVHAQAPTFNCYIANDTFISPTVYQFDLYLLRTGTNDFQYATGQYGIKINSACGNGGTLTASMVAGSSDLISTTQDPPSVSITSAYTFNITAHAPPGNGNGFHISNAGIRCSGTRIGTFRITNSIQFTPGCCMNPYFNFISSPGSIATQVFAYISPNSTDVTSNGTFYSYNTPGTCVNSCPVGVAEFEKSASIRFYPNPFSSSATIELNENVNNAELAIYDVLGTEVFTATLSGTKINVDRNNFQPGIYFVILTDGEKRWMQKIVIE